MIVKNQIISDCFDICPNEEFINQFVEDGKINLDQILNNSEFKKCMVFSFVWNCIFETFPTKKDFINITKTINFEFINLDLFTNIFNSFLFKINANVQEMYKSYLSKEGEILKFLCEKINYRYSTDKIHHDKFLESFEEFLNNYTPPNLYINNYTNPINNSINETISFTDEELVYMQEYEKLQYIIYQDKHFLLKILNNIIIYVDENFDDVSVYNCFENLINVCYKTFDKHVVLFNYDGEYKHDPMFSFTVSKDLYNFFPKIASIHITLSNKKYPDIKNLAILKHQSIYYLLHPIIENTDPQKYEYDRYISENKEIEKINTCMVYNLIDSAQKNYEKKFLKVLWENYFKTACPIKTINIRNNYILYLNFLARYFDKIKNKPIKTNSFSDYTLVLVDNRENILSIIAIMITLANLDDKWDCIVFTSRKAKTFYKKHLEHHARIIHLEELDVPKFHIDVYNNVMTNPKTWEYLKNYNKCLVIQDDGIVVSKGIEKFMNYDYIGSPWRDTPDNDYLKKNIATNLVGNGGLSVRSVMYMKIISENFNKYKNILFFNNFLNMPEDVFYSKWTRFLECKLPTRNVASEFSSEQIINLNSIGFHNIHRYHHPNDVYNFFYKKLKENNYI